jgi:hypothetical protein
MVQIETMTGTLSLKTLLRRAFVILFFTYIS